MGCRWLTGAWRRRPVGPTLIWVVTLLCVTPSVAELVLLVDGGVLKVDGYYREADRMKRSLRPLSVIATISPLLGLLGTVWGVMDAFNGMAQSGSAALSAVAPGISGALLTTIVGLLVALPSMVGYNLLSSRIRRISVQMDNFAQEYISAIQNAYVIEA